MATPQMIAMLHKRKQELIKELQAIDVLLAADQQKQNPSAEPAGYRSLGFVSTRDQHIALLREKTEATSWKDYVNKALGILGPARATAVTELIIDTNNHKIPDERVKDAVSTALSALVKEKKLTVKNDEEKQKVYYPAITGPQ